MNDFRDKVAVITGAASGIGLGIAHRCVQEGMKVVLADVDAEALVKAEYELKDRGASALSVRTDVSRLDDVESLARHTLDAFGGVHLLFNNAGVWAAGPSIWESSWEEWKWVVGVNLWGVLHGVKVFVPLMLAQDVPCHVVNTASVAGLLNTNPFATYMVTKHAVVGLSEHLYRSLVQRGTKVKASVLCPGFVNTGIFRNLDRNRPHSDRNEPTQISMEYQETMQRYREGVASGMPPKEIATRVFAAIREERFYILPHPEYNPKIQARMEAILQGRNPE